MKTSKIRVRKDLKDTIISTTPGIVVDNSVDYEAITAYHDDNGICVESTLIFIQNEWHQVNNIDFE